MTKYLEPSFSTFAVGSDAYRENHDRIFGKKDAAPAAVGFEEIHLTNESGRVVVVRAEAAGSCESSSPANRVGPTFLQVHTYDPEAESAEFLEPPSPDLLERIQRVELEATLGTYERKDEEVPQPTEDRVAVVEAKARAGVYADESHVRVYDLSAVEELIKAACILRRRKTAQWAWDYLDEALTPLGC